MADEPVKQRRTRKVAEPVAAVQVEVPVEVEPVEPEPERMVPTQKQQGKNPPLGLRRPMEQGDRGKPVIDLQERLTSAGFYQGKISGVFGYETMRAVRRVQGANGMRPSGVVDAATWAAINGKAAK
jgi:hypothetical protein